LGVVCTAASLSASGEVTISATDALTASGFTVYAARVLGTGTESVIGFYIAIGY
jgi:hypothetical protein